MSLSVFELKSVFMRSNVSVLFGKFLLHFCAKFEIVCYFHGISLKKDGVVITWWCFQNVSLFPG